MSRIYPFICLATAAVLAPAEMASAQADPNRGLWVGEVTLTHVNEVSVPLDENNIPIAPNPEVPTPTSDDANLRVILHVNGAGQVSLLRDVALVKRKPGALDSESDIALLTDESLYGAFPPQPAQRIATATFDFGDPQATAALTTVIEKAIEAAYATVAPLTQEGLVNKTARDTAIANAFTAATASTAAPSIIPTADVAAAFSQFLTGTLNLGRVDALAAAADPNGDAGLSSDANSLRGKAKAVADASFYGDQRAPAMVEAIVSAVVAAPAAKKQAAARAVAASFADTVNNYQRFIAGELFGDMITSIATEAAAKARPLVPAAVAFLSGTVGDATTKVDSVAHGLQNGNRITITGSSIAVFNGTHAVTVVSPDSFVLAIPYVVPAAGAPLGKWIRSDTISDAVAQAPGSVAAEAEAIRIQVTAYSDQRALAAIGVVREAIVAAALNATFEAALLTPNSREALVKSAGIAAGREALADDVARYSLPAGAPSSEYTAFVRSAAYAGSATKAANAVAAAMIEEKATNTLATEGSIKGKARAAAYRALDAELSAAARSLQTFVRVESGAVGGGFGAGKGDPRLTVEAGGSALGGPALTATLVLPASHPTNPFRHRRHPDHTLGFEITRKIRFDFDAADPSPSPKAGFGVDRLTGVYREEIFGLHKPLGPNPETSPIGLRTEGRFEIYRISLIDTLNAR